MQQLSKIQLIHSITVLIFKKKLQYVWKDTVYVAITSPYRLLK